LKLSLINSLVLTTNIQKCHNRDESEIQIRELYRTNQMSLTNKERFID
jgi:hypothetical protein